MLFLLLLIFKCENQASVYISIHKAHYMYVKQDLLQLFAHK